MSTDDHTHPQPPADEPAGLTPAFILQKLWAIASADLEPRRGCCRCCWGENFDYQRTPREYRWHTQTGGKHEGGSGYNALKPPNPECPECFGKGEVSPDQPAIRPHLQIRALELLARYEGMFKLKQEQKAEARRQTDLRYQVAELRARREIFTAAGVGEDFIIDMQKVHPEASEMLKADDALRAQAAAEGRPLPEDPTPTLLDDLRPSRKHAARTVPLTREQRHARVNYALDFLTPKMVPFALNDDEKWWFEHRHHRPLPVPPRLIEYDFKNCHGPPV